jgi:lysophospholipase L1-like esterase
MRRNGRASAFPAATQRCCSYRDHPGQSWSTGGTWYDGISSHYERIKRRNSAITGHAHNNAVTGAKMSAAAKQASAATAQHAAYVTVLLGANDLCTSSPSTMPSRHLQNPVQPGHGHPQAAAARRTDLRQQHPRHLPALEGAPHQPGGPDRVGDAHICPSMLAAIRTEAERQQVVAREVAFNHILAEGCHQYGANCRWDGGATYNYKFSASQVSALDFHPDLDGQAALASVTWAASWWPTT